MKKIGLLSDTHGRIDPELFRHFESCDELWHAGDIGSVDALEELEAFRPVRAVYGNIDGPEVRDRVPEDAAFEAEGVSVFMTHIGGYPGRYVRRVRDILASSRPQLYICGHSHILKIVRDKELNVLHVNPGACGVQGIHRVKTVVRFEVDRGTISRMEVVEWPRSQKAR